MVSRDADTYIIGREVEAVREWIESDHTFHIMRDHMYHCIALLGGMIKCDDQFISKPYQIYRVKLNIRHVGSEIAQGSARRAQGFPADPVEQQS